MNKEEGIIDSREKRSWALDTKYDEWTRLLLLIDMETKHPNSRSKAQTPCVRSDNEARTTITSVSAWSTEHIHSTEVATILKRRESD